MTSLYLCYQSLLEPLTQTQVVAYLEGLAKNGYGIVLLTFEPRRLTKAETAEWRSRLKALGIDWHWLRYHKRPTVPATLFDVLAGIIYGSWLIWEYGIRLVHARAHVPGLMAYALKFLTRVRFLFDVRGFMAEEYVDAGVWPAGGLLFRATKRAERVLVRNADGVIVLTEKAKSIFLDWYGQELRGKPFEVIPCCVDFRRLPNTQTSATKKPPPDHPVFAYAGKFGGWYLTSETIQFVSSAVSVFPNLRWKIWTQSEKTELSRLIRSAGIEKHVDIGFLTPDALALELHQVHVGLALIKPCFSKLASSATKVAEYLLSGLPVVATSGIGDTDQILCPAGKEPVGVLLRTFGPEEIQESLLKLRNLLNDPLTPARCLSVAEKQFHLEKVGWSRYRNMYRNLLGLNRTWCDQ